jgi:hypothetical protein
MSKLRKTWAIIGAATAGGVTITIVSLATPLVEAGKNLN